MHPHLPMEMPHFPRETRHPHPEDVLIDHWRCIISLRYAHLPQKMSHLPREMWYLRREMCVHLQNSGYVTLLVIVYLLLCILCFLSISLLDDFIENIYTNVYLYYSYISKKTSSDKKLHI
jgi:hypothetical protein